MAVYSMMLNQPSTTECKIPVISNETPIKATRDEVNVAENQRNLGWIVIFSWRPLENPVIFKFVLLLLLLLGFGVFF